MSGAARLLQTVDTAVAAIVEHHDDSFAPSATELAISLFIIR
jgi:hypothetical protein